MKSVDFKVISVLFVGLLVCWFVGWMGGWVVGWFDGWMDGWMVCWVVEILGEVMVDCDDLIMGLAAGLSSFEREWFS